MFKRIAIAAAVLCVAATPGHAAKWKGVDGYQFETKQYTDLQPHIIFVAHQSLAELRAAAPAMTERRDQLNAWSLPVPKLGFCIVHMVDPLVGYYPEDVGHEVLHCIYGDWHPKFTARGDKTHARRPELPADTSVSPQPVSSGSSAVSASLSSSPAQKE